MQRLEKNLAQTAPLEVPEWPSYGNFCKVTQNPHFLKKCNGNQGKFLKNRPKISPRLKGKQPLWRQWHYPLIKMHLTWKDWKRFRRKQRLKKCPNGQVMSIFGRSPKTHIFRKSAKKETKRSFSNIAQKEALASMGNSTLAQMSLSSKLYLLITQRLQKILAQKAAPKLPEWLSYANSRKVTQNPHFLKKSAKGGPRKIFKKSPEK